MFNEREMSKAIDWLFELFSPEDYEGYDEDEIGYAGGLCLPEVCTALRGAAQTVYQYSVAGGYEKCFNYRGMELFDQRACLIISDVEQAVLDEIKTTYETELWLMEDRPEAQLQPAPTGFSAGTGIDEQSAAGTESDRDSSWPDDQFHGYFCAVHHTGTVPEWCRKSVLRSECLVQQPDYGGQKEAEESQWAYPWYAWFR